jgi:hypothetical protein
LQRRDKKKNVAEARRTRRGSHETHAGCHEYHAASHEYDGASQESQRASQEYGRASRATPPRLFRPDYFDATFCGITK